MGIAEEAELVEEAVPETEDADSDSNDNDLYE